MKKTSSDNLKKDLKAFAQNVISPKHPDSEYDPKQLIEGVHVEHEHTPNNQIAKKITKDHLNEFPDYYTRLKKMEDGAKKSEKKAFQGFSSRKWKYNIGLFHDAPVMCKVANVDLAKSIAGKALGVAASNAKKLKIDAINSIGKPIKGVTYNIDQMVKAKMRSEAAKSREVLSAEVKTVREKIAASKWIMNKETYPEYDSPTERIKSDFKTTFGDAGIGGLLGAGAGLLLGGSGQRAVGAMAGGASGALIGGYAGSIRSTIQQTKRDNAAAEKRYAGDDEAIRKAKIWGPLVADNYVAKKSKISEADKSKEVTSMNSNGYKDCIYKIAAETDERKKRKLVNDIFHGYSSVHDDEDVPAYMIASKMKEYIGNHPQFQGHVEDTDFNAERANHKHPKGGKVLGGMTAGGAGLGALAMFLASRKIPAPRIEKILDILSGAGMGAMGGAMVGSIVKGHMNRKSRQENYGEPRHDNLHEIMEDAIDHSQHLINEKLPFDQRMKLKEEREKRLMVENTAKAAIGLGQALGNNYINKRYGESSRS